MQVLIGQPTIMPKKLLLQLQAFFEINKGVRKAYLACLQYPDPKLLPITLIGLEVDSDFERTIVDLKFFLKKENFFENEINFVDINNSQFKDYFKKIEPFYTQV